MPDLQKLHADKERIVSTVKLKGPSFPARISREVGIPPLFVSALLSELLSERRLKLSNMKVGSSPIYLIPGQEKELENFSEFLNHRERQAFNILKDSGVLSDESQEPAIRVALRSIKDFAIPLNVKFGDETKLFWKYFTISDEIARKRLQHELTPNNQKKQEIPETKQEIKKEIHSQLESPMPVTIPNPSPVSTPIKETQKEPPQKILQQKPKQETPILQNNTENLISKKPQKPKKEFEFPSQIKEYMTAKDIEFIEEIINKKKEFTSKIRIDTLFGKQEYLLIAKEKKKVNEQDLAIAVQKAQSEKMPALFVAPGELDKNAKEYLKEWKNLIKFEKLKL